MMTATAKKAENVPQQPAQRTSEVQERCHQCQRQQHDDKTNDNRPAARAPQEP